MTRRHEETRICPRPAPRGMAIPMVIAFLILIVPVVFTLFMRSRTAVKWLTKISESKQALSLAEEGESRALELIRIRSRTRQGSGTASSGDFRYWLRYLGTGDADQRVYCVAARGTFRGETRSFCTLVDVLTSGGSRILVPRDRAIVPLHPFGGDALNLPQLVRAHESRLENELALLIDESYETESEFLDQIQARVRYLGLTDLSEHWTQVSSELRKAKIPPAGQ